MKVRNMTSNNGNSVPNQFIIRDQEIDEYRFCGDMFQSYETCIAFKGYGSISFEGALYLDRDKWDYSRTTSKYRNQFTGLTTSETKAGIKDGSIKLVNLN